MRKIYILKQQPASQTRECSRLVWLRYSRTCCLLVQEKGFDTVDANRQLGLPDDAREYTSVHNILDNLGIESIQLIVRSCAPLNGGVVVSTMPLSGHGCRCSQALPLVAQHGKRATKCILQHRKSSAAGPSSDLPMTCMCSIAVASSQTHALHVRMEATRHILLKLCGSCRRTTRGKLVSLKTWELR
jgi:hypothetical protein